jgi:hypothetical protein
VGFEPRCDHCKDLAYVLKIPSLEEEAVLAPRRMVAVTQRSQRVRRNDESGGKEIRAATTLIF